MHLRLLVVCLATIAFFTLVSKSDAKLVKGHLKTVKNFYLLTDFCAQDTRFAGFSYHFMSPVSYGIQQILIYFDEQWFSAVGKNCTERLSVLKLENNQIIGLDADFTPLSRFSGCSLEQENDEKFYNCSGSRKLKSMQPRCWYIAVARCTQAAGNVQGLQLTYTLDVPSMRSPGTRSNTNILLTIIVTIGSLLLSV